MQISKSYVYIITTNLNESICKIGKTEDYQRRLDEANHSNKGHTWCPPQEYKLEKCYECNNCAKLEKLLHTKFNKYHRKEWGGGGGGGGGRRPPRASISVPQNFLVLKGLELCQKAGDGYFLCP